MLSLWWRELLLTKRKIVEKKDCWHSLTSTIWAENHQKYCRLLEEAGIDYRIWMRADDPEVVRLRERLEHPERYRIKYYFFVRRHDFKKACRKLNVEPVSHPHNSFFNVIS